jgi:hypothetical protein
MNHIFDTLKGLKDKQDTKRPPMHIYIDEKTGQIKEELLSKDKDMAASAYIKSNPAKLIHDHMFGY